MHMEQVRQAVEEIYQKLHCAVLHNLEDLSEDFPGGYFYATPPRKFEIPTARIHRTIRQPNNHLENLFCEGADLRYSWPGKFSCICLALAKAENIGKLSKTERVSQENQSVHWRQLVKVADVCASSWSKVHGDILSREPFVFSLIPMRQAATSGAHSSNTGRAEHGMRDVEWTLPTTRSAIAISTDMAQLLNHPSEYKSISKHEANHLALICLFHLILSKSSKHSTSISVVSERHYDIKTHQWRKIKKKNKKKKKKKKMTTTAARRSNWKKRQRKR